MAAVELLCSPAELQSDGPRIRIAISNPTLDLQEALGIGLEFPPPLQLNALIDTGASVTVINPEVARTCKLRQTGVTQIVAAGSSGTYGEHAAAITFPGTELPGFDLVRVVACPIVRQVVSCLIGRDILRKWRLEYDGRTGHVTIID